MKNLPQGRDKRDKKDAKAPAGFIPPHGGYEMLLAYHKALVVFDATVYFCDRFIDKRSRTHDHKVTHYLLGRQIRRLEQDFLKEGGLRERMTRARLAYRATQNRHP